MIRRLFERLVEAIPERARWVIWLVVAFLVTETFARTVRWAWYRWHK